MVELIFEPMTLQYFSNFLNICDAPQDFWPNDVIWAQDHKTEIGDQTQISSRWLDEMATRSDAWDFSLVSNFSFMILISSRFLKNDVKAAGPKISWSVKFILIMLRFWIWMLWVDFINIFGRTLNAYNSLTTF
jgi:hypothetical protein